MELIPVGAQVDIGEGIVGTVTGIHIRSLETVQYEVAWWDGRARKSEWLTEDEVKTKEKDMLTIGFKQ